MTGTEDICPDIISENMNASANFEQAIASECRSFTSDRPSLLHFTTMRNTRSFSDIACSSSIPLDGVSASSLRSFPAESTTTAIRETQVPLGLPQNTNDDSDRAHVDCSVVPDHNQTGEVRRQPRPHSHHLYANNYDERTVNDVTEYRADEHTVGDLAPSADDRGSINSTFYFGAGSNVHSNSASIFSGTRPPTTAGVPSGSFSPPNTLVNSDRASLRVHTGSIRERYLMFHGTDRTYYDASGRSRSISLFDSRSTETHQSSRNPPSLNGLDYLALDLMDVDQGSLSVSLSGSEGGASTTRVRMATDLAYDALRIGTDIAVLGGHRALSFAASSDPGLPGSYYEYYYSDVSDGAGGGPQGVIASLPDDEEIVSLVRSDVAVYSGVDDVKFPFLPDNLSEFSGSIVGGSPSGQQGPDAAAAASRFSREPSEPISQTHFHAGFGRGKLMRRRSKGRNHVKDTARESVSVTAESSNRQPQQQHIRRSLSNGRPSSIHLQQSAAARRHHRHQLTDQMFSTASPPGVSTRHSQNIGRPNAIMRFFRRIAPRNSQE